jgi:glycosyltransferase involved in cell wall biosynthesis
MRILHCPTDVGGVAWTLSRAERKLGLESTVMIFQKSQFDFPADIDLGLDKTSLARSRMRILLFLRDALTRYDVFHFNYGTSLMPYYYYPSFLELGDLPILRGLGKGIVVTYQGSDVRQKSFYSSNLAISARHADYYQATYCNDKADILKMKRAAKFERHADKIFAITPDLLHWLPAKAEFLPIAQVDLNDWQPERQNRGNKLTLLHSPTNRAGKGTKYILEAIERLEGRYRDIELILVEGIPHDKVKDLYRKADLVIDQLLGGWYGGFAVEAMALGKPVVCYIREEDLKFIPSQMKDDLPIVNATPDTIYEVLSGLVEQRDQLRLMGERSRAYVERWHDPMKIALRTKEVYESICIA